MHKYRTIAILKLTNSNVILHIFPTFMTSQYTFFSVQIEKKSNVSLDTHAISARYAYVDRHWPRLQIHNLTSNTKLH